MSTSLRVQKLGKSYGVYNSPQQRLKRLLTGAQAQKIHWSLRDVSFSLQKGQCLGVIGDNGAGKSTLLKLLAGTLHPTEGSVQRSGQLTAILELGAGFHPEFTGRQNLVFAAGYMGFSTAEINELTPSICDYSELGEAIDRPLKTYSSGMVVRLAFALVTAKQPEVLIIDEALAVGDQYFQKKCIQRIETFRQNGCTILFCSHSLYHVRQLCDQVLWLEHGQVKALGPMDDVISAYETHVRLKGQTDLTGSPNTSQPPPPKSHSKALSKITQVVIEGMTQRERPVLKSKDLRLTFQATTDDSEPPSMGFMLEQFQGVGIMSLATHAESVLPQAMSKTVDGTVWAITLNLPDLPLHSGTYVWSFYLFDAQGLVILDEWKNHIVFDWVSPSLTPGLVRLPHTWG